MEHMDDEEKIFIPNQSLMLQILHSIGNQSMDESAETDNQTAITAENEIALETLLSNSIESMIGWSLEIHHQDASLRDVMSVQSSRRNQKIFTPKSSNQKMNNFTN